jgi:glycine cleavage system H protein
MSQVPAQLRYTKDHEWVREESDGSFVVGITDHAQQQLGELVYVELPETGRAVGVGDGLAVVESTKAASDVYAPLAGTVVATNPALAAEPEQVNADPYGKGWLVRLNVTAKPTGLLDAEAYRSLLDHEA